jgi:hypothetical protein
MSDYPDFCYEVPEHRMGTKTHNSKWSPSFEDRNHERPVEAPEPEPLKEGYRKL